MWSHVAFSIRGSRTDSSICFMHYQLFQSLIRKKLGLKTQKSHGMFLVPAAEIPKLERLYQKYGIPLQDENSSPKLD